MPDTAIPIKMSLDTLASVLCGLGAFGIMKFFGGDDITYGLFGIACIFLALIVLYFRNRWNETQKEVKTVATVDAALKQTCQQQTLDAALGHIESVVRDDPELMEVLKDHAAGHATEYGCTEE